LSNSTWCVSVSVRIWVRVRASVWFRVVSVLVFWARVGVGVRVEEKIFLIFIPYE
jgi:hypothetical protein